MSKVNGEKSEAQRLAALISDPPFTYPAEKTETVVVYERRTLSQRLRDAARMAKGYAPE